MTKDNRTSLKASHGAHNRKQPRKRGLLLSFIIFMAWVAGIGLLLSLVACNQASAKPIATDDNNGYYNHTTKHSAAKRQSFRSRAFSPSATHFQ